LYLGSVRFFKHLILFVVLILIAVPAILAAHFFGLSRQTEHKINELNHEIIELSALGKGNRHSEQKYIYNGGVDDFSRLVFFDPAYRALYDINGYAFSRPSYQDLYPDMFFDGAWQAVEVAQNTAYLTFDDGPSQRTVEILDILDKHGVKATFFVVGNENGQSADIMRSIAEKGHTIALHSYSHDYSTIYSSVEGFLDDFYKIFSLVKETTGVSARIFRFPGGSINAYNAGVYREIISEMLRRGFIFYDWNVSAQDASFPAASKETIVKNVLKGCVGKVRSFILLHDSASQDNTVLALEDIIKGIRDAGIAIEGLTEDVKPLTFAYPANWGG
jgi:peptidoglycan/xylan/chitin deacetylase (PgdA/CDA1 family)